jgi:ribose 5-phosphate isomerase RpiB
MGGRIPSPAEDNSKIENWFKKKWKENTKKKTRKKMGMNLFEKKNGKKKS